MNYEEILEEVATLIDQHKTARNIAREILDFLDGIGYDNSRAYKDPDAYADLEFVPDDPSLQDTTPQELLDLDKEAFHG